MVEHGRTFWKTTLIALLAAIGVLSEAAAQAPRPEGPLFTIAGGDGHDRRRASIGMNERGRYVVAWDGFGDGDVDGIFARVYDERGVAQTAEFRVNTTTTKIQRRPRASMDESGNFVIAWESQDQDGSGYGIYARVFGALAAPRTGELQVNQKSSADQFDADVASFRDGRFIVVWTTPATSFPASNDVSARWFAADGTPRGGENSVDPPASSASGKGWPSVTLDAAGVATVTWDLSGGANSGGHMARRFDSAGVPLGNAFATRGQESLERGDVSADGNGAWVTTSISYNPDYERFEIWADAAAPPGDSAPNAFRLVESSYPLVADSTLALDARGGYVVTWGDVFSNSYPTHTWFRRYGADGTAKGSRQCVQESPFCDDAARESTPSIGVNARGDYLVAYDRSAVPVPANADIVARRYCADLTSTVPASRAACVGGSAFLSIQATGRTPVNYQWRKGGVALFDDAHLQGSRSATLVLDPVQSGDAGSYDCVIGDACPTGGTVTTAAATLTTASGARLGPVTGLKVTKVAGGQIRLTWTDVAGATDYVVYDDRFADTGFIHVAGTATSGATGLTLTPPKDHRQYRVAARTSACGAARPD